MHSSFIFILFITFSILSCRSTRIETVNVGSIDTTNSLHKPQPFQSSFDYSINGDVDSFNKIALFSMGVADFDSRIRSSTAPIRRVLIYKTSCHGVYTAMESTAYMDSMYGNKVDNILILANNLSDEFDYQYQRQLLFENHIYYPTYFVSEEIPSFKDDRQRGKEFREKICEACLDGPLTGLYFILYDSNNVILAKGTSQKMIDSIAVSKLGL